MSLCFLWQRGGGANQCTRRDGPVYLKAGKKG